MEDKPFGLRVMSSPGRIHRAFFLVTLGFFLELIAVSQTPGIGDIRGVTLQVSELTSEQKNADALALGEPALAKAQQLLPPDNGDLLQLRLLLSSALISLNRNTEAENQLRVVIAFAGRAGPNVLLRNADSQLSYLVSRDGRLFEARQAAHGALSVQRMLPNDDYALGLALINCATFDTSSGDSAGAISELLEAQGLLALLTGDTLHTQRYLITAGLVVAYRRTHDHKKLYPRLNELKSIATTPAEKHFEQEVRDSVDSDDALADGRFNDAIAHLARSQESFLHTQDFIEPYATAILTASKATLYFMTHNPAQAAVAFRQAIHTYQSIFETHFLSMTESEKHQFVTDFSPHISAFYSFCLKYQAAEPQLADDAYSLALWQKSMVADSLRGISSRIAHNSNGDILERESLLQSERIRFAEELRNKPNSLMLPQMQARLDTLERDLGSKLMSAGYSTSVKISDVRESLSRLDAAVEVVTFQMCDENGATNRVVYAAIILQPGGAHSAIMRRLGDAQTIEASQSLLADVTESRTVKNVSIPNDRLYNSTPWQGIEPLVLGARRIYMSPAGTLDATPFFAWRHSDGRYLIDHDEIDLRPVFSTADLVESSGVRSKVKTAMLIGNPDFGSSGPISDPQMSPLGELVFDVTPLPATQPELDSVKDVLQDAGFRVYGPLEQKKATKTALLSVQHPAILHIATHGYFLPMDVVGAELDPLGLEISAQRSGLLLAGANQPSNQQLSGLLGDNGVVTAFEAAGLDLQGTELVTLSACQTGLGERSTAGEVLGLRRAFHIAGAKTVMVSMWTVDDAATRSLMKRFYEKWIRGGEDPFQALRHAAQEIKAVNDSPHIWAPFVLYGP